MPAVSGERQPVSLGFALRDPWPWLGFAGMTRLGEALGYGVVFLPEVGARDTFAALTGLAGETGTLRLATGVVPLGSRSVRTIAMGAATVHERSGGRAILGLGTGPVAPGALDRLREALARLRDLLATQSRDGVDPIALARTSPVPLWIAALGPRAVRLAGEAADGVLLNWCSPPRVAQAREAIHEVARDAGRPAGAVTVGVYVRACLHPDEAVALAALRRATGEYASYPAYARQFAAMGLGQEAEAAAAAHSEGRPDDVPERLVRAICLLGDPAEARARLAGYVEAGATVPVVYPVPAGEDPGASVVQTLEALAPGR